MEMRFSKTCQNGIQAWHCGAVASTSRQVDSQPSNMQLDDCFHEVRAWQPIAFSGRKERVNYKHSTSINTVSSPRETQGGERSSFLTEQQPWSCWGSCTFKASGYLNNMYRGQDMGLEHSQKRLTCNSATKGQGLRVPLEGRLINVSLSKEKAKCLNLLHTHLPNRILMFCKFSER